MQICARNGVFIDKSVMRQPTWHLSTKHARTLLSILARLLIYYEYVIIINQSLSRCLIFLLSKTFWASLWFQYCRMFQLKLTKIFLDNMRYVRKRLRSCLSGEPKSMLQHKSHLSQVELETCWYLIFFFEWFLAYVS